MKITLELTEEQNETLCKAIERYKHCLYDRVNNPLNTKRLQQVYARECNDCTEITYQLYNQPE